MTSIKKQKGVLMLVATTPNVDVQSLTKLPSYLGERQINDPSGLVKAYRFSDNQNKYEILFQENGIMRAHIFDDNLREDAFNVIREFFARYSPNQDTTIPAGGFIMTGYVYSTDIYAVLELYSAIIAPAHLVAREAVGLVRGITAYSFNMANKPYQIMLKANWEASTINLEFTVVYNVQNITTLDIVLPDMVATLKEEYNILERNLIKVSAPA